MGKLLIIILVLCVFKYCLAEDESDVQFEEEPSTESAKKSYDTKFDNVDLEDLLKNDRLLKNYVKCLEYEGPCTPDGKMLREILPDALLTNCEKCSEKQRIGSEIVIHYLIDERKEYWGELERIYDPDGSYRTKYLSGKKGADGTK